jgi:hypothetical protein
MADPRFFLNRGPFPLGQVAALAGAELIGGSAEQLVRDVAHGTALVHRLLLEPPERLGLGHRPFVHELALRLVEQDPRLQPLTELARFLTQAGDVGVTRERNLDGREKIRLLERFDHVRERAGPARARHEIALGKGRQDHDRGKVLLADALGRGEPVQHGHLDVHDHEVGGQLARQSDGRLAVCGLADDLEPLFLEHLLEVEADDGLVLRDHGARGSVHPFLPAV